MKGTTNIPVVNVILRRGNQALFLRRKNTGWQDGNYGLPSGHVEKNESFKQAACREVFEETGIKLNTDRLHHKISFHQTDERGDIRVGIYFEVTNWSGEPKNTEPELHDDLAWFDIDSLPEKVIETTRIKFDLIKKGEKYTEIGWA